MNVLSRVIEVSPYCSAWASGEGIIPSGSMSRPTTDGITVVLVCILNRRPECGCPVYEFCQRICEHDEDSGPLYTRI